MQQRQRKFTQNLLKWYHPEIRPLPWKEEKDPYLIWLSEIIMQQTRVEQGWPYYDRFREKYPTVQHLAHAPEDEVMRLWQGLGYYSRARNLHAAAKYITEELDGKFPDTYNNILSLKGVGPYTAAAIASFAYGLPHAVVDGNVFRVLSRYFGIETPIDSTAGKKEFNQLAQKLLPPDNAARYNQAIMDFGALICKPAQPLCKECPLRNDCVALASKRVKELPVKEGKLEIKERFFHYLVIEGDNGLYIRKRTGNDIWRNLYEFPMIEADRILNHKQLQQRDEWQQWLGQAQVLKITDEGTQTQKLTHRKIHGRFVRLTINGKLKDLPEGFIAVKRENLNNFAFPRLVHCYLSDKTLYLNFS